MTFSGRKIVTILCLLSVGLVLPNTGAAVGTPLYLSVERALNSNPKLQAFTQNRQAVEYDLKQARGGYLPTVDLQLGYGLEQHSDVSTRQSGTQPSDSDWDPRTDATLKLIQKVYDGGATGSQVLIRKALLNSIDYRLQAAEQRVALDAITAHLNVFRQRQLVALAEKNLKIHREIHQSLAERERAGAGSIADVSQAQARLARSESTLYLSQAELNRTIANYTRVVGTPPGVLAYAGIPETLPQSLAEIQQQVEQLNPELLAVATEVVEAESRSALARTLYKPKIDLELSSRYNNQQEGDTSWQNTNAAMLNLRWNLFNGGQDRAGTSAALSREMQSRSMRTVKLDELTETAAAAWTDYLSLQQQKTALQAGVNYSRKTFDAYLKQFSVSQRSLLDVLSAENEYFQAATQLISVDINETLAAYQLLSLSGQIQTAHCSDILPDYYLELSQELLLPEVGLSEPSPDPITSVSEEQEIQKFVEHWALSWREQNLESYLACYNEQFLPESGVSYQHWRAQRNQKVLAPDFIDLFVSDMQIVQQSPATYQVSFIQEYRSNQYQDRVRKNLLLKSLSGTWKIVREISQPISALSTIPILSPLQSPVQDEISIQTIAVLHDRAEQISKKTLVLK